jgi:four helix bundle protein
MKRTFKDLIVWQQSFELALSIYRVSESIQNEEIRSSLCQAVVNISGKIAFGYDSASRLEFSKGLNQALAFAADTRALLYLLERLQPDLDLDFSAMQERASAIQSMLLALNARLKEQRKKASKKDAPASAAA